MDFHLEIFLLLLLKAHCKKIKITKKKEEGVGI